MRAVLCKEYGPPESLVVEDVDPPPLHDAGVRIRVHAAGVNFPDVLMIKGEYQFKPPFPFSPGGEVAGEVLEVGPQVEGVAPGDRVLSVTGVGAFAEEVVANGPSVMRIPDSMDWTSAAALGMTYGTSVYALAKRASLAEGEWLLVHGASGGVGLSAVEIGRALGARVIATGGDNEKLKIAGERGADHIINYREAASFKDAVKEITEGAGADVIYDPVGGDVMKESLRCISWGGRLLVIGFASGDIPDLPANLILLKSCQVVGVFWGAYAMQWPEQAKDDFDQLFRWWDEGAIAPHVSHTFPLERTADALYALINREVVGKAVVTLD
ncbi:MAG: NADPH:quinone oxidoreductase family protein [Actinobacteria bacterium]|nr:NADPH:quinone oxidoreductase family protein [Actinomycetota bacterium]